MLTIFEQSTVCLLDIVTNGCTYNLQFRNPLLSLKFNVLLPTVVLNRQRGPSPTVEQSPSSSRAELRFVLVVKDVLLILRPIQAILRVVA
jgi:hypothetical protein